MDTRERTANSSLLEIVGGTLAAINWGWTIYWRVYQRNQRVYWKARDQNKGTLRTNHHHQQQTCTKRTIWMVLYDRWKIQTHQRTVTQLESTD